MSCSKNEDLFMPCAYRGRIFRAGLGLGDSVGDDLGGWWVIFFGHGSWKLKVSQQKISRSSEIFLNGVLWSFVLLGI